MASGRRVQLGLGGLDDLPDVIDVSSPAARPDLSIQVAPAVGDLETRPVPAESAGHGDLVDIDEVARNPLNQRKKFDEAKIAKLAASIKALTQMHACPVVTRKAFLAIHPDLETAVGAAGYVLVAGERRWRAVSLLGDRQLKISVQDELAADEGTFAAAGVTENDNREDFGPIEEAEAILDLVNRVGSGKAAAEKLGVSPPLITQRLHLLNLTPQMRDLVRDGEIPIEAAREIGRSVPAGEQMQFWLTQRWQDAKKVPKPPPPPDAPAPARRGRPPSKVRIEWSVDAGPDEIARELRKVLDSRVVQELADLLQAD